MKVWLDDMRTHPNGYERAYTTPQAIELLRTRQVTDLALDHDLGACKQCLADADGPIPYECEHNGTGYTVLCWLERQLMEDDWFPLPNITIHTDNGSARQKMQLAALSCKTIASLWGSKQ